MAGTTQEEKPTKRSMVFEYRPDGVPEEKWRRWPFEPGRMSNREAEAIEDVTGWTFVQWQDRFFSGSMRAVHAALWVYLRRDKERADLEYDDLEFTDSETWFGFVDVKGETIPDGDLVDETTGDAEGKADESAPEPPSP